MDLRVELTEEFDRNFESKSFFGDNWKGRRDKTEKGSLLNVTGKLRRSIHSRISGNSLEYTSTEPYAEIHNSGGKIKVTAKMKKYFWAKYYEHSGKVKYNKNGTTSKSKSSVSMSDKAEIYKNMALMKVGDQITIPKRQYIGDHPNLRKIAMSIAEENLKDYIKSLTQRMNKK